MKTVHLDRRLRYHVTDEDLILDGSEFWAVLIVGDGTYLAAWVDEAGEVHTATRKSAARAVKLANRSWGA